MALENVMAVDNGKILGLHSETAANVPYDNTESGLSSTNVQGAVDEVVEKIISRIYTTKSSSTATHGAYSWHANIEVEGYIPFMYCFQYGQSASAIMGCEGFSYTEMNGYCSVANLDIAIRVIYTKA